MKQPWGRAPGFSFFGRKKVLPNNAGLSSDERPAFPSMRNDSDSLRMSVHSGIAKAKAERVPLSKIERIVFFADGFDSYFTNDGFDGFLAQARSEENFEEYVFALNAIGLAEIATLAEEGARRYSELDTANEGLWGTKPDGEISRPYLEVGREITTRIKALNINIEDVIERYVDANYPWKQA